MNSCVCCGSTQIQHDAVLWKELIDEWRLTEAQVKYVNRQQGSRCMRCGSNLRSMALAQAVMRWAGFIGTFQEFVVTEVALKLRILEINEAGSLTPFLQHLPYHQLIRYPDADMCRLMFAEGAFDVVLHSDTLEHVPIPVRGLEECRRVLRPGGICAFTIPMIVDRLTLSRDGMPPSYHGSAQSPQAYLVRTEYGGDAWRHVIEAGFPECRICSLEYPAAQALVGVR